ncbi:MAG: hypothetical protein SGILL_007694 [Bacillariaceae sp.]
MKPLLTLLVVTAAILLVHLSMNGHCHHEKRTPLERFVFQTLQSSGATSVDREKVSNWWSVFKSPISAPYLKQPQHRALGPGQKEIERMAEETSAAGVTTNRDFFGPNADWTCTTKGAVDYVSCVETPDHKERTECSWCPMGGEFGVCVHVAQALTINHLESWHLKCDPPGPIVDEEEIAFWAEATECGKFNLQDCLSGEDGGNETCTWCESSSSDDNEPTIQFCTSQQLWDELKEKQHSDAQGHVNVDQLFSCRSESRDADETATSLFDTTCAREGANHGEVKTLDANRKCTATLDNDGVNCTIAQNPFPGLFMGATGGPHCVSESQYQVVRWFIGVMKDMGWELDGAGQDG